MPRICRFRRSRNMLPFSDLRSDYPLNFTLFGCLDMDTLKRPFGALVLSSVSAHVQSRTGGNLWLFWCVSADARPSFSCDVPACDQNRGWFPPETRAQFPAERCSFERNASTHHSSPGLAQTTR